MAWIRKTALKAFVKELGAQYSELQVEYTWYGRASFRDGDFLMYCDFTLGGDDGIRREAPIAGCKRVDGRPMGLSGDREAGGKLREKYKLQLLAFDASVNWNPKIDGHRADATAIELTPINETWSVAKVKLPGKEWEQMNQYVHYLVTNGCITSLPSLE